MTWQLSDATQDKRAKDHQRTCRIIIITATTARIGTNRRDDFYVSHGHSISRWI